MNKPKISVLMSVYNTKEEWLRKAINSILTQSYKNFEFIIVLDAPTDNSREIVYEYSEKDNRIKVIDSKINNGLTKSLNIGLKAAEGKYIARMDSDDISMPERLEKELEYITRNHLDIIGCGASWISESEKVINPNGFKKISDDLMPQWLMYVDCIPHPTWMVKKEVYSILNGYRDIDACEDYDFLLRALKSNFKIGFCEDNLLKYRMNENSISRKNILKQVLTSRYLQKNYHRIEKINVSELETYLKKRVNADSNKRYSESSLAFSASRKHCGQKNIKFIPELFFATFHSKYIWVNYFWAANLNRLKLQNKLPIFKRKVNK